MRHRPRREPRRLAATLVLLGIAAPPCGAQAVKGGPSPGAPPPPLTHAGLVPGVSTVEEVRERLGEPVHEAPWYAWKMLYPSRERSGHFDAIHLQGDRRTGKVGNIEAATVPAGHETFAAVTARLGPPEFHLTYPSGQELADYSEQGLRFTFDAGGSTVGVAYFPHGYRRVHAGEGQRIDLGGLPQGRRLWPAHVSPPGLAAGTSEVDLTPEAGWFPPFTVHDPLRARCVVLARGELKVAIVGADLFGMMKSEIDPIEAELRRRGISHLLFAMSHNHAAPDTIGIYGHYPREHVAAIQERVARGVLQALERLEPVAELLLGSSELSLDGARVEGLFRNARNPGIVDPQIAAIQARGAGGQPLVTLVHFACHVEGLEKGPAEISADFPGVMCDRLRELTGAPAVFLNGALGGMVSGDTRARTHEEARKAGQRLAHEVLRVLEIATPSRAARFELRRRRLEIPVTNERFIRFHELLAAERRPWVRGRMATELFLLRLGDAEIVTVPGELLPELSFEILERMEGYPRLIVGLANDEIGYILPAYDFRQGAYEESMSPGPAAGPLVKECALRLLAE